MFRINHKNFEKIALNLQRLSKNIDTQAISSIVDDNGEPLGEKIKDAVVDTIKDKFVDKLEDAYDSGAVAVYVQPKLKPRFLERFRFKKVAVNLFPRELRPVLENIGIAANEQRILSGQVKHLTKEKFRRAIGQEDDDSVREPKRFVVPQKKRTGFV